MPRRRGAIHMHCLDSASLDCVRAVETIAHEALPRIDFAPDLVHSILNGTKTATTRAADEIDPQSDLERLHVGCVCSATSAHEVFGRLRIDRIDDVCFAALDDDLARTENCSTADAMRELLLRFYPALSANDPLRVFYFTRLAPD